MKNKLFMNKSQNKKELETTTPLNMSLNTNPSQRKNFFQKKKY